MQALEEERQYLNEFDHIIYNVRKLIMKRLKYWQEEQRQLERILDSDEAHEAVASVEGDYDEEDWRILASSW